MCVSEGRAYVRILFSQNGGDSNYFQFKLPLAYLISLFSGGGNGEWTVKSIFFMEYIRKRARPGRAGLRSTTIMQKKKKGCFETAYDRRTLV